MSVSTQPQGAQESTREQLEELWQLFLADCLRYMRETPASKRRGNRLAIIRAFLRDNNMTIDGQHLQDVQRSLTKMAELELPFTLH